MKMDKKANEKTKIAEDFPVHTSPEFDALGRSAADGKFGTNWSTNPQAGTLLHQGTRSRHWVELALEPEELQSGLGLAHLEDLVRGQDADAALAFLYISRLLAPPLSDLDQKRDYPWISYDDVISKIGWTPRSTKERREMHERIHFFIRYGARAKVNGERGRYTDPNTGQEFDTIIRTAIWQVMKTETPEIDQHTLFPSGEIPVKVQLAVSTEWERVLASPSYAQYLPMGEVLGAIPANVTSGAWARVIGLSLANFWRRNPKTATDGSLKPTRRELLERFPPKTGLVSDILASKNPRRAAEHWHKALRILVNCNFIEDSGEALIKPVEARENLGRYDWGERWLDEEVDLRPGTLLADAIASRAHALPPAPLKRGRGRPRKSATS